MPVYKLVVVLPFLKYRRGDVIRDQSIVNAILDTNNVEMYQLKKHVRLVSYELNEIEVIEEPQPEMSENVLASEENVEVQLSSVSDEDAILIKNKRMNKSLKGD